MKKILITLFLLLSMPYLNPLHCEEKKAPPLKPNFSLRSYESPSKKKPWMAAAQVFTLNIGVWAFDRYVLKEDFAYIGWDSIKENFKHGFVWDEDNFETNFFMHPYHGSLYFNIARSNGMNFWESVPFAVGGSLMWEMAMENTYPSYNDFIMTTTGGIMLGETLYKLSSLILDDSKRGFARIWREFLAGLINPARGINRLLNGKAYKVSDSCSYCDVPITGYIALGGRGMITSNLEEDVDAKSMIEIGMLYGDPFKEGKRKPFDTFFLRGWISHSKLKPYFSFYEYGLITGKTYNYEKSSHLIGIFQHFDFYNIELIEIGASSIGIGSMNRFKLSPSLTLEGSIQFSWVLCGANKNEYVNLDERHYNFSTGYNVKVDAAFIVDSVMSFYFAINHYGLISVNGIKGTEELTLIDAKYSFNLTKTVSIGLDVFSYIRESEYDNFPDVDKFAHGIRVFMAFAF